ncbi:MAG: UDP-glucose/GDP-mannose dehydrogenase family protein [Proteobacteria bacterium]|nr:UDP-glucose/GDP-mannose dehydrogenase family protein [Pseudomonadota bacterium]
MSGPIVGFAGLTHLGLVSAVGTASKGFRVVGYDGDSARVHDIKAGKLPVVEPDLDEMAREFADNLSFTDRLSDLAQCDIVYISTDVPTDDKGQSDLTSINASIGNVIAALGPEAILIILCQVPPGFTRKLPLPTERLYYQVETLVFGRAVERATKPERFIIGCADPSYPLPPAYKTLLEAFGCPLLPMLYESAELAKIAINCCLVASVTVANTLAELSERIGADWSEIAPALRLDRRIGQYSYLAPGLGIAGGNLERDLATVLRLSEQCGSEASVIAAYLTNSKHRRDWALRMVHREVFGRKPDASLGILGLAYKENTHSVKNSPSLALIENLHSWPITVYDPVVPASAATHPKVTAAASALDAARGADALIVMTPWPQFRDLRAADIAAAMEGNVVIDPFGVLDGPGLRAAGMAHFVLGKPERAGA